ncbi:MAG TPA: hypothetical protein V6C76_02630 [Drouetiella sp.]
MDSRQSEEHAANLAELSCFSALAAWRAPWEKAQSTLAMLERSMTAPEITKSVNDGASALVGQPATFYPDGGWLGDLLGRTRYNFLSASLLSSILLNIGHGLTERGRSHENNEAEMFYREVISALTSYIPPGLSAFERDLYSEQSRLVIDAFKMNLAEHLVMTGRTLDTDTLLPQVATPTPPPIFGFANLIQRVTGETIANPSPYTQILKMMNTKPTESEQDNDNNPKFLIRSANDDFLYHRTRTATLAKFEKALKLLGLPKSADGVSVAQFSAAARRFMDTPYSVPILGGLFFSADKILSMRDFEMARTFLLLEEQLRALDEEPQFGFSKYLIDFMHSHTLGKALMQSGKSREALAQIQDWAKSAESYELPQDISGRTLGSLVVTRILANYALLLDLTQQQAEAKQWWQKVIARSECLLVICELCADRMDIGDKAGVERMLETLTQHDFSNDKTSDLIFYWWTLQSVKSDKTESVYRFVAKQPDFIKALAEFTNLEMLSQRHDWEAGEKLVRLIEKEIKASTEVDQWSDFQQELIGAYLRQALEYQQLDLSDKAEKCYEKGFDLMEALKAKTNGINSGVSIKLAYLQTEFINQYATFLENCNRREEAILIRSQQPV